jgi:hypothetical protein
MRSSELQNGIMLMTESGEKIGESKIAARQGIAMVVFSRILMATPGMVLVPFVMNNFEKRGVFNRRPWLAAPLQIGLLGVILTFATPLACALFQQKASIKPTSIELEIQEKIKKMDNPPEILYYNKGL